MSVMTPQGVVRARSIKEKPESGAWDANFFKQCIGLSWQPQPTQEVLANVLPYKVPIPADPAEVQAEARAAEPSEEIPVLRFSFALRPSRRGLRSHTCTRAALGGHLINWIRFAPRVGGRFEV